MREILFGVRYTVLIGEAEAASQRVGELGVGSDDRLKPPIENRQVEMFVGAWMLSVVRPRPMRTIG
ncbi:hypothetical protein, partial [Hydrogenibacillus schlegelii]|uniref:hypothetical protein n=1 Tax=Hydrogenibacillus schlegelii TaxID=1484 RepID=UPI00349FE47C